MRQHTIMLGTREVAACTSPEAAEAVKRLLGAPHPFDYSARIAQLEEKNRELHRRLAAFADPRYCPSCGSPGKCYCFPDEF